MFSFIFSPLCCYDRAGDCLIEKICGKWSYAYGQNVVKVTVPGVTVDDDGHYRLNHPSISDFTFDINVSGRDIRGDTLDSYVCGPKWVSDVQILGMLGQHFVFDEIIPPIREYVWHCVRFNESIANVTICHLCQLSSLSLCQISKGMRKRVYCNRFHFCRYARCS